MKKTLMKILFFAIISGYIFNTQNLKAIVPYYYFPETQKLKDEALNLYNSYIVNRKHKMPYVTAKIALSNNIDVFICSVLPAKAFPWSPSIKNVAKKVIELNLLLKDYCLKNNIQYVDYHSVMDDGNGGLKVPEHTTENDLVHPNKDGYKVMEGVILNFLASK